MMMLKITTGKEKGRTLELTADTPLTIGRSESSGFCIPDKKVSRRHAEIVSDGENVFITDLSSRTGTRVNGRAIAQRTPLCIGDTIQIGETDLVLEKTEDAQAAPLPRTTAPAKTEPPVRTEKTQTQRNLPLYSAQESLAELYSSSMLTLAKRVQTRVLELLNIDAAAKEISNSEMRPKVADAVDQILREIRHEIPSSVKLDQFRQILLDDLIGLGPLSPLLRDGSISEIMINGPDNLFIESKGLLYRSAAKFNSESHLQAIIQRIVEPLGRHIDAASPMVDARLEDGSRVNAVIPPLALDGSLVTIRKFASKKLTDDDLIKFGSLTKPMALFLREAVRARRNILVSGGTGSGKTTLLNILSQFIPEKERIITVEDSAELKLSHENLCRLEARPANVEGQGRITIRDLVVNTLRMRPDRIIVGECRGAEALDMLQAMNTGHDGSMTTCHANNPRDALSRLENMVMMAGFELPSAAIREQIASAIHLIVQQTRLPDGSRKIVKISEVTGREGNTILLQDIFTFEQEGFDENFHVIGRHTATGNIPTFVDELRQAGDLELDMSVFVPEG
ncbi:Flp pilus assembly complex ATPase component TadA [bacterium]|nr:Flp pilus assembly complex ATPase component TadA [bacterium]